MLTSFAATLATSPLNALSPSIEQDTAFDHRVRTACSRRQWARNRENNRRKQSGHSEFLRQHDAAPTLENQNVPVYSSVARNDPPVAQETPHTLGKPHRHRSVTLQRLPTCHAEFRVCQSVKYVPLRCSNPHARTMGRGAGGSSDLVALIKRAMPDPYLLPDSLWKHSARFTFPSIELLND